MVVQSPMQSALGFDLDCAWRVSDGVAVRPEPFGALVYHFGTRRLSFLKSRALFAVVQSLPEYPTAREACYANGVDEPELPRFERALAALAQSGMITEGCGA